MTLVFAAGVKALPLAIFGVVLAGTLGITWWAAKRTSTATEFWAAGRSVTGVQNGWAIAGDYMSASSFLGFAGLVFLFGVDAFVSLMAALVAFLPVLLFLAERMRNSGKYTLADVLSFRLRERPARTAAAFGTLSVLLVYLVAQMVGAGVLIQALVGISFAPAVVIVGAFMLAYVIFGGMLATTWVQIIKAVMLMAAGILLTILVLAKFGFNPGELFTRAAAQPRGEGRLPASRPAVPDPARDALLRHRVRARHGRAAAHPRALLHGARREGRARLGRLGRVPDRRLLPDGHGRRRRRAGDPRPGGRGGGRQGRQPRDPDARREPRRRRGLERRRDLPRRDLGGRARDDPRGRRRPRDLGVRRGRPRPVEQRRAQGPRGLRARGGLGGEARGDLDRRAGDRARDRGRRGLQRLRPRRPGVLHRGERELPGARARAVLEALQHRGRGDRDRHRRRRVGRAHPAERSGLARHGDGRADARSARWRSTTRRSSASRWASWAASSGRCSGAARASTTYHELFVRSETGLGAEGVSGVRRRPRTPARRGAAAVATQVLPK